MQNNLRFPGQYFDQETGLHYNYHRYYDPQTGKYLTPDPYKGNIADPGTLIPYVYCSSNPNINIDENGLSCTPICIPHRGQIETKKLYSEKETWLSTADVLCYYFTRQRDLMQKMLSMKMVCIIFEEDACEGCVYDHLEESDNNFALSKYWTSWNIIKRFSEKPIDRYMGHTGPVTVCPSEGTNFKGAIPSLIP